MHELIGEWIAANGETWKKKIASRSGLADARAGELLAPTVEALFTVLQRGRLDLAGFVRSSDPASLVAAADARGLALHHGLDMKVAQSALSAVAPGVLDVARKTVRNEVGVERMLQNGASANQVGAIGDLANRLYRQRSV